MKLRIYDSRILAIDVRHRRLGFAVFEGHRTLLGWGKRVYPASGEVEAALASKRIAALLSLYVPDSLVVLLESWHGSETPSELSEVKEAIIQLAAAHRVPIQAVIRDDVRASFSRLRCTTREEMAASLGRMYPELAWQVPPLRRTWQSEHPRMIIFDAIALGLAYWLCDTEPVFEPEEKDEDVG